MKKKSPRKETRAEEAYVRDMALSPVLEKLDRRAARIISGEEYPEPLKRFRERERCAARIHAACCSASSISDFTRNEFPQGRLFSLDA